MNRILFLLLILVPALMPATGTAQTNDSQDTTIYVGNRKLVIKDREGKVKVKLYEQTGEGETVAHEQIFEGIYIDGQSTERRWSTNIPFTGKKKSRSHHQTYHDPHIQGFYIGYTNFGSGFINGTADAPNLVANKSWEWGINFVEGAFPLTYNNQWALTAGAGFGYTSFRLDGNYGFRKTGSTSAILPPEEGSRDFSQSRLRYFHTRIPVALEWQKYSGYNGPLFLSLGCEAEVRWSTKSKVKYGDKDDRTLSNNLNVRPVGVNALVQGGYGNWGLYARYSMFNLFETNKGPQLYPFSMGVTAHW